MLPSIRLFTSVKVVWNFENTRSLCVCVPDAKERSFSGCALGGKTKLGMRTVSRPKSKCVSKKYERQFCIFRCNCVRNQRRVSLIGLNDHLSWHAPVPFTSFSVCLLSIPQRFPSTLPCGGTSPTLNTSALNNLQISQWVPFAGAPSRKESAVKPKAFAYPRVSSLTPQLLVMLFASESTWVLW